jgi:hypothetical protein
VWRRSLPTKLLRDLAEWEQDVERARAERTLRNGFKPGDLVVHSGFGRWKDPSVRLIIIITILGAKMLSPDGAIYWYCPFFPEEWELVNL